jgi:hypothetical protein
MVGVDYGDFEAADDLVVWRYMSVDRLRDLLAGHLYFAAARQFEDPFEGAITAAEQGRRLQAARRVFPGDESMPALSAQEASRAFEDLRRMTKINCWHAMPHEKRGDVGEVLLNRRCGCFTGWFSQEITS